MKRTFSVGETFWIQIGRLGETGVGRVPIPSWISAHDETGCR